MARVVWKSLRAPKSERSAGRAAVGRKTVTSGEGRKTVHTLDANTAEFDAALTYVFSRNVAKARRENKRILGQADLEPAKT